MSLIIIVLLLALGYALYTMLQTYRSLERELREIRLKCMGKADSAESAPDPAETMTKQLVARLQQAVRATAPAPLPI